MGLGGCSTFVVAVMLITIVADSRSDPLSFAATCDDNLDFYTDGVLQGSSAGRDAVLTFDHTKCPQVAAVYCQDVGILGGIRASFGNNHVSYVTDGSWKCLATDATPAVGWNLPGFDDSNWGAAVMLPSRFFSGTYPGISEDADWIWTTTTIGIDRKVYCRKMIPSCGPEPTTTESNGEVPTTTESNGVVPTTTESNGEVPTTTESNGEVPTTTESNREVPTTTESIDIFNVTTGADKTSGVQRSAAHLNLVATSSILITLYTMYRWY